MSIASACGIFFRASVRRQLSLLSRRSLPGTTSIPATRGAAPLHGENQLSGNWDGNALSACFLLR